MLLNVYLTISIILGNTNVGGKRYFPKKSAQKFLIWNKEGGGRGELLSSRMSERFSAQLQLRIIKFMNQEYYILFEITLINPTW